jgi:hypothetical protein
MKKKSLPFKTVKLFATLGVSIFLLSSCQKENKVIEGNKSPITATKKNDVISYSKEDLFKGIVFARGYVADMIPPYAEVKQMVANYQGYNDAIVEQRINTFITQINSYYPTFLDEFKEAILSHDYVAIDHVVTQANEIVPKIFFINQITDPVNFNQTNDLIKSKINVAPDEFDAFVADLTQGNLTSTSLDAKFNSIFGNNFSTTGLALLMPSGGSGGMSNSCINFGLAINIAIAINVVGYINVALAANIELAANIHAMLNFWGSGMANASDQLKHEMLIQSIAEHI